MRCAPFLKSSRVLPALWVLEVVAGVILLVMGVFWRTLEFLAISFLFLRLELQLGE
jgi:hypothetical protein